jgi:peptidoglycan/xylan/chitin deacetylase (PgdA/CDA1 family)
MTTSQAPRADLGTREPVRPTPDASTNVATPSPTPITVAVKRRVLGASSRLGILNAVRDSKWRQQRLLILCYHSISIDDEHEWSGTYSMSADLLESRFRMLRDGGYNVLPLDAAIRQLYERTLPPRSVVLTFDDGMYDFQARAWPLLQQFGFPATVYLTTFYAEYRKPIFGLFCSYVLWRARHRMPRPDTRPILGRASDWDLATERGRQRAHRELMYHVAREQLSLPDRSAVAEQLTGLLGDDYAALEAKRVLTVMTRDEAAAVARDGVDLQLHTHRHRTPSDRTLFLREINDNRARIDPIRTGMTRHFCYPSGVYRSEFLPWLREAGVQTATTCDPGLASSRSEPLLLPRLVDTSLLSPLDVEGWMTGMSAFFMPRKARAHTEAAPVTTDA